jgi:hypothetical protein
MRQHRRAAGIIARPGNAGSTTAADHIAIIDAAIAAIPERWRRNLLITVDGAGCSHDVVKHLETLNTQPGWSVAYSVGFDLNTQVRAVIGLMPAEGWSYPEKTAMFGWSCCRSECTPVPHGARYAALRRPPPAAYRSCVQGVRESARMPGRRRCLRC